MSSKAAPFLNKSHNFGIFLKKGKRGILQLDFPSQMLLMIQRGHIKKTQPFNSLLYFETEEDLHISIRFLDGELDFDADTTEEKYAICRLLDLILETENAESMRVLAATAAGGGVCVLPRVPLVPTNVLKDGVLEKKGNTTITTWNRRRVKISAGEFSYYKPGEELALNVVQLRHDRCGVQRVGQNSIQLSVIQRLYCFRVPTDSKGCLSVEALRDDWIKAFEQAMTMKRAVSLFSPPSPLPADDDASSHHGDSENTSDVSSTDNSSFISGEELPETFTQSAEPGNPEITASVSVHFSYNNKLPSSPLDPATSTTTTTTTAFVNTQPPKPAKKATVYPFRRNKEKEPERHGSARDVVSRPHPDSLSDDLPVTALRARFTAHSSFDHDPTQIRSASLKQSKSKALNDRVLAFSDLNLGENDPKILTKRDRTDEIRPGKGNGLDRHTGKIETPPLPPKRSGKERPPDVEPPIEIPPLPSKNCAKERPSVFDVWNERNNEKNAVDANSKHVADRLKHGGRKSFRDDTVFQTRNDTVHEDARIIPAGRAPGGTDHKNRLSKACSMTDLLHIKDADQKDVMVVKKPKAPPPPPPPSVPAPPSLPPPLPVGKGVGHKGGVKLKQVHWTPVEKKLVSVSLWSEGKTHVPTFDLSLLETMFAISEREGTIVNKSRAVKQTLVDSKRAQNLGILFSGFKADTMPQVMEALSSVTELDSFQMQKMTTLKRFQPSAEDMEMFRMYRHSRDSLEPVDRFMLDLCEIPKLGMRIDLTLALWDLPNNYEALLEEVEELLSACEVLLSHSSLPLVLRCLLVIGNHLNAKRQSKQVPGFQISSVDKMVDLKGRDPQYSLMTYLVDQLHATRPDVLDWSLSLDIVSKVAGYSVKAIGAEIDVLKNDLQKVKKYQRALKGLHGVHKKFQSDVQNFVLEYEKRMHTILDKNDKLKHRFQQLLAWLGEPSTRTSDVLFSSLALLIERFNTARARLVPTTVL